MIAILYFAQEILIPLALAVTLALILSPPVAALERWHIPRFAAAFLVLTMAVAATGAVTYVIVNELVGIVNEMPRYSRNIDNKLEALRAPGGGELSKAAESVQRLSRELNSPNEIAVQGPSRDRVATPSSPLPVQVIEPAPAALTHLQQMAQPFLPPLAKLVIILVFTLFLLLEAGDVRNRLVRLAGLSRLNVITKAMEDGTHRVSRYLLLQFLVNAGFGVLCGSGLYLIGVPYAILWGAIAGLLRIVPYVGSITAGLLPLLLSLAVFDGWRSPALVFLLFTTLELITGNVLEPRLYGAHTGISALALLVTTAFWTTLWGMAGLVLSTPLTVCLVVLGRHVPQLSFLHVLLGDQPVLTPDAHFYQRLLAMDEREARAVVDQFRLENSIAKLYDTVLIPALTLAEHDRHKGVLDPEREEFLFISIRELIADLGVLAMKAEAKHLKADHRARQRVVCFPANDEADEIAAVMLSQLLAQDGYPVISVPLGAHAMSLLNMIEPGENDIFCVSSVPPYAFSHARTLSRELQAKFPKTKIVIGVWGYNGDGERALLRFQPSAPDKLVKSLAEAFEYFGIPLLPAEVKPAA